MPPPLPCRQLHQSSREVLQQKKGSFNIDHHVKKTSGFFFGFETSKML